MPEANGGLVRTTTPTFAWTAGATGSVCGLEVQELGGEPVWTYVSAEGTSARFNANGMAVARELTPGYAYRLELTSTKVLRNLDERVHLRLEGAQAVNFVVFSPQPVIQRLAVERQSILNQPHWYSYSDVYRVTVTDCSNEDVTGSLATMTATTPEGKTYPLEGASQGTPLAYVAQVSCVTPEAFTPPREGDVSIALAGRSGWKLTAQAQVKRAGRLSGTAAEAGVGP